jgi:hypothetical protein
MAIQLDKLSPTQWWFHDGGTSLLLIDTNNGVIIPATLTVGTQILSPSAEQLNAIVAGVAAGYRVARGVAAITGSGDVVTGLTTCVAVIATATSDLDGDTLAGVSATIGNQAGAPAAGSVTLKCWKVTTGGVAGNPSLIAANAAKNVNWLAIGT